LPIRFYFDRIKIIINKKIMNEKPYLSVVAPLYNEEGNAKQLHSEIVSACQKIGKPFEIIFIVNPLYSIIFWFVIFCYHPREGE